MVIDSLREEGLDRPTSPFADVLFGSSWQFVVPIYQRVYSWEAEQLDRLWEAIEFQRSGNRKTVHFMGAIVLAQPSSQRIGVKRYSIVDGQQRMITLQLLLAALRDSSSSKAFQTSINKYLKLQVSGDVHPSLIPGPLDRADFDAIILQTGAEPSKSRVSKTYQYFLERLKRRRQEYLVGVNKIVLKRLRFVRIVADPSTNPLEIFETLNHDGLPLKPMDLVANKIFMTAGAKADSLFLGDWKRLQDELADISLDDYLLAWAQFEARMMTKKKVSPTRDTLFVDFKHLIMERLNTPAEAVTIVRELADDATSYVECMRPVRLEIKGIASERTIKSVLEGLRSWSAKTPADPVIYQLHYYWRAEDISAADYLKALVRIESFLVRWTLAGLNRSPLTSYFRSMAQSPMFAVGKGSADVLVKQWFNRSVPLGLKPSNDLIRDRLTTMNFYSLRKSEGRYVLGQLAVARQQLNRPKSDRFVSNPRLPESKADVGIQANWQIDHIVPINFRRHWTPLLKKWKVDPTELDSQLNLVGNLCLIAKQKNASLLDAAWCPLKENERDSTKTR
jgi:hypothetical protein